MSRTTKNADARDRAPRVVAVVEDDADLREIYAEYLEGKGFTVVQAENGLEALLQIKRARPASVVLDLSFAKNASGSPWRTSVLF